MTDMNARYWLTLKWALEVMLSDLGEGLEVIFDPVVAGKVDRRFYTEVTYRLPNNDYILKMFHNNEVGFSPDIDIELARRVTAAFEKWCEWVYERAFVGSKL